MLLITSPFIKCDHGYIDYDQFLICDVLMHQNQLLNFELPFQLKLEQILRF